MKVAVDSRLCISAGQCALTAPTVFGADPEDAVVVVLDPEPPPELRAAVRAAVRYCPAAVITVLE